MLLFINLIINNLRLRFSFSLMVYRVERIERKEVMDIEKVDGKKEEMKEHHIFIDSFTNK